MTNLLGPEDRISPASSHLKAMNPSAISLAAFLEALAFAAQRHRRQTRKDVDSSPYINHPIEVARILSNVGKVTEHEVLIAALLHDTLEDTETTHSEIKDRFGLRVATIVAEVTDDQSLSSEERKRLQVKSTPNASHEAKLIRLADKIANVRDVLNSPPCYWSTERRRDYI